MPTFGDAMKLITKSIAALLTLTSISVFAAPTLTIHVINQTGSAISTHPLGVQPNVYYLKLLPDSLENNQSGDIVLQDTGSNRNPQFGGAYQFQVANGVMLDTLELSYTAKTETFAPVDVYSSQTYAPDWNAILSSDIWDAKSDKMITYTITQR